MEVTNSSMQQLRIIIAVSVSALMTLAAAAPAWSQETLEIEEITVTATKREQSIQDVPISITAFSGDDVQQNGWSSPVDIMAWPVNSSVTAISKVRIESSSGSVGHDLPVPTGRAY